MPLSDQPTPFQCIYTTAPGVAWATSPTAPTTTIAIRACPEEGAPHYYVRVVVTSACGAMPSPPTRYTICYADFDCDGVLTADDLFDFMNAWFAGDPATGGHIWDIFYFLTDWFAGC